jgi:hypothetical protein
MSDEELTYWLDTKKAYENSLKNNVGHRESIVKLLEKINDKLARRHPVGH